MSEAPAVANDDGVEKICDATVRICFWFDQKKTLFLDTLFIRFFWVVCSLEGDF